MNSDRKEQIRNLVEQLNKARRVYEQEDREIMSNAEYDALYDELKGLEEETGIVMASSPTVNVGYEVVSSLPKEKHPEKMLSLDKTKSPAALSEWLGDQEGILSWKMDGLTIVLTYSGGRLEKAVTRGNGEIGEVITANARAFSNIPLTIPFEGRLVLRGEAIIRYSVFERINREIPDTEARYKNPRNLCSGTVRQLDPAVTAARDVEFHCFGLVSAEDRRAAERPGIQIKEDQETGSTDIKEKTAAVDSVTAPVQIRYKAPDFNNSRANQLEWVRSLGFDLVHGERVTRETVQSAVSGFAEAIKDSDIPSDGLVLIYDNIEYGRSLGRTAKFPRDAIAFKWQDETAETRLLKIEWSPSRTGLINPIAVFEPVELEGTSVSRASVHNLSILEELKLGIGDRIEVYKANMIIPQILRNLTESGNIAVPEFCPVCGGRTEIRQDKDTKVLVCTNPLCQAKHLKSYSHFASRNAMNIEGLSEATLEKLVGAGLIASFGDIFRLNTEEKRRRIAETEGLGEISAGNIIAAVEKARHTTCGRLLYALGIPGIGAANAQLIAEAAGEDWDRLIALTEEELLEIPGIGAVLAGDYAAYFRDQQKRTAVQELAGLVEFEKPAEKAVEESLSGLTFVVTGSLSHFENRDALKAHIKGLGGKVTGSVSGSTDYLINNDSTSGSTKNKKAMELGVRIITEEEFLEMCSS